jgi:hypothetical protein
VFLAKLDLIPGAKVFLSESQPPYSTNPQLFMEPEISLPCSQDIFLTKREFCIDGSLKPFCKAFSYFEVKIQIADV